MSLFVKPKNAAVAKPDGSLLAESGEAVSSHDSIFWKQKERRGDVKISELAKKSTKRESGQSK
jgi:hypothetical protein